jgi:hypothetical protein
MQKALFLVAALLGVAVVAGSVTRGSQALTKPGTIRITTGNVKQYIVNRGGPGRDAGDLLVVRQLLYNRGITPRAIGHADVVCTYTTRRARQCSGTFFLPRGKIVVAGGVVFRQFYELAIIGGTGLYNNVRGSMTVTLLARSPMREILLFRLVV